MARGRSWRNMPIESIPFTDPSDRSPSESCAGPAREGTVRLTLSQMDALFRLMECRPIGRRRIGART